MRMLPVLLALLAALGPGEGQGSSPPPGGPGEEQGAPWGPSEASLLSLSLLQLGSGLKEQVDRSRQQVAGLFRQLALVNGSVGELLRQAGACRGSREALGRRAAELEEKHEQLQRLYAELQGQLRGALELGASLDDGKGQALQERTGPYPSPGAEGSLTSLLTTQSLRIDELFTELELQHSKMNAQEATLEHLVKRTGSRRRKSGCHRQE